MITYATYSTNAWITNTVETWAHDASISANGRYVSFSLNPQNVVGWWDTWSGEVIQANRPEITQSAFHPAISADGLRVAFDDNTRLFFADFSSGWPSNRYVGMSQRVRSSPGSGTWLSPIFSPDDRWILFGSTATDLVTNTLVTSPFTFSQLFAQRVETRQTRLVSSRPSQDQSGFAGDATNGVFSADSRFVVFEASDPYGTPPMILRHDLLAGGINLLVCSNCSNPSISGDGRGVVFQQPAPQPGRQDIVLIDLLTGISNLVSVNVVGTGGGNGLSVTPRISHDARYVVFTSTSDDLITADTNRASDIFVRDLLTGTTRCLSMRYDGTGTGNQLSSSPVLAANGRTVVFSSFAGDLVPGDANGTRDVFVASLGGPDTDLDGMDDDWEMAYFNTQARDGHGDFDHDGVADLDEFRAGTNPADDTSTLRVLTLQSALTLPVDGTRRTVLTWSATPGRTYRVQAKEDVAGAWIDLEGDVLATSTTATKVEILPAGVERRFHRVVLLR